MTRRAKMVAVLAALVVVAVIIAVVALLSSPAVEVKFVGWETNGAARVLIKNRSGHIAKCSHPYPEFLSLGGSWNATAIIRSTSALTLEARSEKLFVVQGTPDWPWRVSVNVEPTPRVMDSVRRLLRRVGFDVEDGVYETIVTTGRLPSPTPPQ
jgi:hypothetical protein